MNKIEKISLFIGKYMALIVLFTAAASLCFSHSFLWIKTSWINYLLIIIMFGMGLTLKPKDFILVLSYPKEIILGCIIQYTFMPLTAFGLSCLFHLDTALSAGVILVGTCPGGTASNVITYLSKGDTAFSVCMTSINTLLSPVLTPFITYLLLKSSITVDIKTMFLNIISIVLIPVIIGIAVNRFFSFYIQKIKNLLPVISVLGICIIISSVVSHNAEMMYKSGITIFAAVILHNLSGYLCGFAAAKIFKMNIPKTKAFSIEIGMQNSGLASGLANGAFTAMPEAAVPGAVFSVWHNISGALLAALYRRWNAEKQNNNSL